ncbi:MAG: 3-deoxy-manno-octulosonate cytidylyltransferase [Bacteroidetes bacterium]|nr:MAG: 3-deoxy-manno-octulosonate cytidylyltransferase [Bacteroidota bacterium]
MKILGIIPARFASTRFPGKPLVKIGQKTMIQRVYEQTLKSKLIADVIVATDNQQIFEHVISFGGKAIMTSETHQSGTDRCQEVVSKLQSNYDFVINVQGDEPFINPQQIDALAQSLNENTQIATLYKKITSEDQLFSTNTPKVIKNINQEAIYFSRHPIPFLRGVENKNWLLNHDFYKHIGLYAYKTQILEAITKLQPSKLEKAESLEQLRWLENGFKINLIETNVETFGIDSPEDLQKIQHLI